MVISIRQAERNDALHVAALIDIAGHGIEAELWNSKIDSDQSPIAAARRMIIEDVKLPYHISKAYLLDVDGEIAGGLIGGPISEVKETLTGFPSYFAPLLDLESRVSGYWAAIGVTIYQEFRGQGLARHLLDHAEFLARR